MVMMIMMMMMMMMRDPDLRMYRAPKWSTLEDPWTPQWSFFKQFYKRINYNCKSADNRNSNYKPAGNKPVNQPISAGGQSDESHV